MAESKRKRRRRGTPKNYAKLLDKAERAERRARVVAMRCAAERAAMSEAIRGISRVYHPYDLATGAARPADDLAASIAESFDKATKSRTEPACQRSVASASTRRRG